MLMYMAARAQLVEEAIQPALAEGATVVSDRYLLANLAYQAHAGGLAREDVLAVARVAVGGVMPDRVFLLDIDPATADRRREGAADRMESRGAAYREKLRSGFLEEAKHDPARIAVIDASGSVDKVQAAIRVAAAEVLGLA